MVADRPGLRRQRGANGLQKRSETAGRSGVIGKRGGRPEVWALQRRDRLTRAFSINGKKTGSTAQRGSPDNRALHPKTTLRRPAPDHENL